jgi:ParB family transcriptional regulator, chromosome partitioning protein
MVLHWYLGLTNPNKRKTTMNLKVANSEPLVEFDKVIVQTSSKAFMRHVDALPSKDVYLVEINDLRVMPNFNFRIEDASLDEHIQRLAESMAGPDGFMQDKPLSAIAVDEGDERVLYVYDGHSRLAAAKRANSLLGAEIQRLPVVTAPNGTTLEDITAAVFLSSTGRGLLPYEMAVGCKRLSRFGWSSQQIAKRIGITATYVEQLLTLAGAPADVRQMVIAGTVSAAVAVDALRKHGAGAGTFLSLGFAAAQRNGKAKLTPRFMPQAQFVRQVKKQAPVMFDLMRKVTQDPAYENLSHDIRSSLDEVLQKLVASEMASTDASTQTSTESSAAEPHSPASSDSKEAVSSHHQEEAVAA